MTYFATAIDLAHRWRSDPAHRQTLPDGTVRHHRFIRRDGSPGDVLNTAIGWVGTTARGNRVTGADMLSAMCAVECADLAAGPAPPRPGWFPGRCGGWVTSAYGKGCILSVMPSPTGGWAAFLNAEPIDLSRVPGPAWMLDDCPPLRDAIQQLKLTTEFPDPLSAVDYAAWYVRYLRYVWTGDYRQLDDRTMLPLDNPTKDPFAFSLAHSTVILSNQ